VHGALPENGDGCRLNGLELLLKMAVLVMQAGIEHHTIEQLMLWLNG
jgi:hypothetical protein